MIGNFIPFDPYFVIFGFITTFFICIQFLRHKTACNFRSGTEAGA